MGFKEGQRLTNNFEKLNTNNILTRKELKALSEEDLKKYKIKSGSINRILKYFDQNPNIINVDLDKDEKVPKTKKGLVHRLSKNIEVDSKKLQEKENKATQNYETQIKTKRDKASKEILKVEGAQNKILKKLSVLENEVKNLESQKKEAVDKEEYL